MLENSIYRSSFIEHALVGTVPAVLLQSFFMHRVLLILLGIASYANTFQVPFHFDDVPNIMNNPFVHDLRNFLHPSDDQASEVSDAFASRYIGYLSFALNYAVHGPDIFGYHLVNLVIHLLNALLGYQLVLLLFRSPFFADAEAPVYGLAAPAAFCTALLFVAHPVQTQAVTYIVQRFTSLATLFFLGAMVSYTASRLPAKMSAKTLSYLLSIVTNPSEGLFIIDALAKTASTEGDICEFGVAQGATSALMANEIKSTAKNLWLFDSFKGLPRPTEKDLLKYDIFNLGSMSAYEGTMACEANQVIQRLEEIAFPKDRINIVSGFIEETIRFANLPAKVSFAFVDFDFTSRSGRP